MNRAEMLKRLKAGEDALELSIEKWQDIAAGNDSSGAGNCALCEEHLILSRCRKCVIFKKTNKRICRGTPYETYVNVIWSKSKKKLKKIAQEEVEFLKSLRKGGRKQE